MIDILGQIILFLCGGFLALYSVFSSIAGLLDSTHQIPVVPPHSCEKQNYFQTLLNVPVGRGGGVGQQTKSPPV